MPVGKSSGSSQASSSRSNGEVETSRSGKPWEGQRSSDGDDFRLETSLGTQIWTLDNAGSSCLVQFLFSLVSHPQINMTVVSSMSSLFVNWSVSVKKWANLWHCCYIEFRIQGLGFKVSQPTSFLMFFYKTDQVTYGMIKLSRRNCVGISRFLRHTQRLNYEPWMQCKTVSCHFNRWYFRTRNAGPRSL